MIQRHMRSHTDEKPYSCEFCKRGLSQVTTLKKHRKDRKMAGKAEEEQKLSLAADNPDKVKTWTKVKLVRILESSNRCKLGSTFIIVNNNEY